jgi:murein DD-endopeptidase MepM/ murein hydrolase activator NlpD
MKWLASIFCSLALVACVTAFSTRTPPPATASPQETQLVPTRSIPARTSSPSPSRTSTPTPSPSLTPSDTPRTFRYIFPVQPPELAAFVEGGHSYATDIFAPVGTHFVAVTDGVVDFVSYEDLWDPSVGDMAVAGGLCVAIVGDDGVRYYGSHLSTIAEGIQPGARVAAGQLLGLVGKSGNAATTPAHVHFGISHPTYPEDWLTRRGEVNPIPFLVAWRDGHGVTPPVPSP